MKPYNNTLDIHRKMGISCVTEGGSDFVTMALCYLASLEIKYGKAGKTDYLFCKEFQFIITDENSWFTGPTIATSYKEPEVHAMYNWIGKSH